MALARIKTWISEVLTAADLNAEFSNILSYVNGTSGTYGGTFTASDGAAATPSIAFTSDTDTGFYRIGANDWALSAGGTKVFELTSTGPSVPTGSVLGVGQAGVAGILIVGAAPVGSSAAMQIAQSDTTATTPNANWLHKAASGNNIWHQFYSDAGDTLRGSIDYNRAGGAVRYNTTSSAEFKTAIVDLAPEQHEDLSAVVDNVQLREFEWRENPGVKTFGVITEELANVYPDAVNGDGKQYDRSMLIFPLLAKCKALEARLAALEVKVGP